jgi:hypothetical protein
MKRKAVTIRRTLSACGSHFDRNDQFINVLSFK